MSNNFLLRSPKRRPGSRGRVASPRWGRSASLGEQGQAALILVIGLVMLMTTIGGVMLTAINNNDPILTQASIQRLAYRALASGLNAYQSAINGDPFLAACNTTTNVGAANASAAALESATKRGAWCPGPM